MTLATQYRGRSRTSELATTNGFNASPDGGEDSACRGKPEAESGGARWISSLPNAQDPPPPPSAAATSHTSTHAVGSRNNPLLPVSNRPNHENGRSFKGWYEFQPNNCSAFLNTPLFPNAQVQRTSS